MAQIRIHHRTIYRYRHAVNLSPHRLMLRPREGRDLRLLSHEVSVTPQAQVGWATDVFGNAVATAVFNEMADVLTVDSVAMVDLPPQHGRSLRSQAPPSPFPSVIRMRNGQISAR